MFLKGSKILLSFLLVLSLTFTNPLKPKALEPITTAIALQYVAGVLLVAAGYSAFEVSQNPQYITRLLAYMQSNFTDNMTLIIDAFVNTYNSLTTQAERDALVLEMPFSDVNNFINYSYTLAEYTEILSNSTTLTIGTSMANTLYSGSESSVSSNIIFDKVYYYDGTREFDSRLYDQRFATSPTGLAAATTVGARVESISYNPSLDITYGSTYDNATRMNVFYDLQLFIAPISTVRSNYLMPFRATGGAATDLPDSTEILMATITANMPSAFNNASNSTFNSTTYFNKPYQNDQLVTSITFPVASTVVSNRLYVFDAATMNQYQNNLDLLAYGDIALSPPLVLDGIAPDDDGSLPWNDALVLGGGAALGLGIGKVKDWALGGLADITQEDALNGDLPVSTPSEPITWLGGLLDGLYDMLAGLFSYLFVPSNLSGQFNDFVSLMQSKLGILLFPFTFVYDFINRFLNVAAISTIQFNAFYIFGYLLIPAFTLDFMIAANMDSNIMFVWTTLKLVFTGFFILNFINYLRVVIERILNR